MHRRVSFINILSKITQNDCASLRNTSELYRLTFRINASSSKVGNVTQVISRKSSL